MQKETWFYGRKAAAIEIAEKLRHCTRDNLDIVLSRWTDATKSNPFVCTWQAQVHDTVTNVSRDDFHSMMFHVHRRAMSSYVIFLRSTHGRSTCIRQRRRRRLRVLETP